MNTLHGPYAWTMFFWPLRMDLCESDGSSHSFHMHGRHFQMFHAYVAITIIEEPHSFVAAVFSHIKMCKSYAVFCYHNFLLYHHYFVVLSDMYSSILVLSFGMLLRF